MSEIQEQAAVETKQAITEAPASQAQPVAQPQQNPDGFLAQHRIETGSNEWKDGLLDCFHDAPDNLCLKGFCCPCFVYGKTQARLRDPEMKDYERFNTDCLMFVGASYCCGLSWLFPFFRRTDIRTMYDIRGNVLGDCGRAFCCLPCTLIQNDKEVVHRQSLQATDKTGYQAVPGMNAGQQ